MQGYDSVEIKADVELGGTEQRFNILWVETCKEYGQESQIAIFMPLLEGTDGLRNEQSFGNYIESMKKPMIFMVVMSIPDN